MDPIGTVGIGGKVAGGPLRVFLSHTSDLGKHTETGSFVAAAVEAVLRARHAVTDMAYFAARDTSPAAVCVEMVAQSDVYVGIVGLRYGSPVRDRPDVSYTELEFEAAGERGQPRLIVLIRDDSTSLPLTDELPERRARQVAFRRRLLDSGLTVVGVGSPAELELAIYQALMELAPPIGSVVGPRVGSVPSEIRGRTQLLQSLRRGLDRGGLIVLTGMGGVGKSTVAAELARQALKTKRWIGGRRRAIWWVPATDSASMTSGLVSLARTLGGGVSDLRAISALAPDAPDRLWTLLERAPRGWLLILDNADDPRLIAARAPGGGSAATTVPLVADGTGWARSSHRGLVLVTTRHGDQSTWGRQARIYSLPPLSEADGARVLLDLAPHAGSEVQAEALARRLGGLPLALHLAGTNLGSAIASWRSFDSYRLALDANPGDSLLNLAPDPGTALAEEQRAVVMFTWELSLDALAAAGLPESRPLLRLLSCYAAAVPIPGDILRPDLVGAIMVAPHGSLARQAVRLDQALRGLTRMGLIDAGRSNEGILIVHPVIADTNRLRLLKPVSSDPNPDSVRHCAVALLIAAADNLSAKRPADWPRFQLLTPHLHVLLSRFGPDIDPTDLDVLVRVINRTAEAEERAGASETAITITGLVVNSSARLGPQHPSILVARQRLIRRMLWTDGRAREAEVAFGELLEARRQALGENHFHTLTTHEELGWAIGYQGRWVEAEAIFRVVLDGKLRTLGEDHNHTLWARYSLAWAVGSQGHWTQAEVELSQVLNAQRRILGEDAPDTLVTRRELAHTLAAQGRSDTAERAFRVLLADHSRVLGGDNFEVLLTHRDLAWVVSNQGRWREAEVIYQEVFEAQRRVMGEDAPDALATRRDLAWAAASQRRWTEAETALRKVLEGQRRVHGEAYAQTLTTRNRLARVVSGRRRWAEAEAQLRSVLQEQRQLLGAHSPDTLVTAADLAYVVGKHGRYTEAKATLLEVFETQRHMLGEGAPDAVRTRALLASIQGREPP